MAINMPGFGSSKREQPWRWPWTHTKPTQNSSPSTISYRIGRHAPECQRQAMDRRKIMRKARSKTKRPQLLAELERRYLACSSRV